MEKFLESFQKAEKIIQDSDHIVYVTYPLIKDKRLLLKVLQEVKNAMILCINSILQYEYLYKRVRIYSEPKENFRTFSEKCAPRYKITPEEIKLVVELFELAESHKSSPFEFEKNGKIVIISNSLKPKTLTVEKMKEFLILSKNILRKTGENLRRNF